MAVARIIIVFLSALYVALPAIVHAQADGYSEQFHIAEVKEIIDITEEQTGGITQRVQTVKAEIVRGERKGETAEIENAVRTANDGLLLSVGDKVVIERLETASGGERYFLRERYRLPALIILAAFFLALGILLAGWKGIASIGGLAVSILILVLGVVPLIAAGYNPLGVSLLGSCVIACASIYLAHGFSRRTSVALLSTLITLAIASLLAVTFVGMGKLFGLGTEEALFLQTGELAGVNLKGLLLGGIIIGALGVLDDITTAQTAAIYELKRANATLTDKQIWQAGMSIGKEHIASLVNTLALAYVGASFPMLLLFTAQDTYPLWVTLNSEFIAEEVIRTLVGSCALLFAVPISTWCAVKLLGDVRGRRLSHGHFHVY